jgi:hypothetical protein
MKTADTVAPTAPIESRKAAGEPRFCRLRMRGETRPPHVSPAWRGGGSRKSRRALHRRLLLATAGSISGAIAIYAKPASAWLMRG